MSIEQFIVGSIMVVATTAWTVWQFLFMPRLREVDEQRHRWQLRAEAAEHEIRNADMEGVRLIPGWEAPMEILGVDHGDD